MKKIASLLMAALMLAAMLCAFAVPASAASDNLTVDEGKTKVITGEAEYDLLTVNGILLIKAGAELTACQLDVSNTATVMIEPGAKIKANNLFVESGKLYIPSEVTLEIINQVEINNSAMFLEPGALLKVHELSITFDGKLTVCAGATVVVEQGDIQRGSTLDLYGTLKSKEGTICNTSFASSRSIFNYHDGALLDLTFEEEYTAGGYAQQFNATADGNRVYRHDKHFCINCGEEQSSDFTASTLSEGSMTIIVGVACLAVGFLVAMFIFKKKKPALAGGENKDEEE